MRIIDLSVTLSSDRLSLVPGHPQFSLREFHSHEKDFRSNSYLQMSTHTGTHVDAPFHFIPDGVTIDRISLERLCGAAVLIDLRKVSSPRKPIDVHEIINAVGDKDIRRRIVVLHAGWLRRNWGTQLMYAENPFLSQSAADWLVAQQIKALGLDFSVDSAE
ncbi:MAG: hypothetical protein DRG83_12055, partial [Deltaproteobacteria bacterium]